MIRSASGSGGWMSPAWRTASSTCQGVMLLRSRPGIQAAGSLLSTRTTMPWATRASRIPSMA